MYTAIPQHLRAVSSQLWKPRPFTHTPLDYNKRQIRLITIHSRAMHETIKCTIEHFDLDRYPDIEFAALSYTWLSSRSKSQTILINSMPFTVSQNLFDFLAGVASISTAATFTFWIDQLCIDQSNTRERNHQVQHMNVIFSKAREVIVWLGRAGGDSKNAMDVITNAKTRRQFGSLNSEALLAFFDRAFWRRMWIVQEVVLARRLFLLCGDGYVLWEHLQRFYNLNPLCYDGQSLFDLRPEAACVLQSRPYFSAQSQQYSAGQPHFTLLDALHTFRNHECQDERDKIFGIQGVVLSDEQLQVDYNLSIVEVFLQSVARIVLLELGADQEQLDGGIAKQIVDVGRAMSALSDQWEESLMLRIFEQARFNVEADNYLLLNVKRRYSIKQQQQQQPFASEKSRKERQQALRVVRREAVSGQEVIRSFHVAMLDWMSKLRDHRSTKLTADQPLPFAV